MSNTRWIFISGNRKYRIAALIISVFLSFLFYFYYSNIFIGTFFLFLFSYFSGAFKGRRRIEIIPNQTIDSAITELTKLIDSALGNIYIFTRSLNPSIYNQIDVIGAFERAKARGVTIQIICERGKLKKAHISSVIENRLIGILKMVEDRRIELFFIDKDLSKSNHFVVVDNISFRLEQKHGDEPERKAMIVYRSKKARALQNLFEKLRDKPHCCNRISSSEVKSILAS